MTEGKPAADELLAAGDGAAGTFTSAAVTTTSSGGSKSGLLTDWTPLAGRDVVLLPHNDNSGAEYRDDVLARLGALATSPVMCVVELPGSPVKGDAADSFNAGHTVEELERLVETTGPGRADAAQVAIVGKCERPIILALFIDLPISAPPHAILHVRSSRRAV